MENRVVAENEKGNMRQLSVGSTKLVMSLLRFGLELAKQKRMGLRLSFRSGSKLKA